MRVVIAHPNQAPIIKDIPDTLRELQTQVGGYIDIMRPTSDLDFVVNEDLGYAGPIVVTSHDSDGNTIGLSDNQVILAMSLLT